ncbi:MAG: hypothetical protein HY223_03335 [Thaumarchaeota archaeon]|nr:hypothetical protein [Nitrososphaerota archaeon]
MSSKKQAMDGRQLLIIQTQIMRLPLAKALPWLEVHGYKISTSGYYRELDKIKNSVDKRSMEIAQTGFLEQHMARIDTLLVIEREMWDNYHSIEDPFKRILAAKTIAEMQPYLAGAYNKTRAVMEKQAEMKSKFLTDTIQPNSK